MCGGVITTPLTGSTASVAVLIFSGSCRGPLAPKTRLPQAGVASISTWEPIDQWSLPSPELSGVRPNLEEILIRIRLLMPSVAGLCQVVSDKVGHCRNAVGIPVA